MFRKFGDLNAKRLLDQQAEILHLEFKLNTLIKIHVEQDPTVAKGLQDSWKNI